MDDGNLFLIFTGLSRIMKNQMQIMEQLNISAPDNVDDKEIVRQLGYVAELYLKEWKWKHDSKN